MRNEVLNAIYCRRSIRHYLEKKIPLEVVQQILEAGTWAPTAMGRQDPIIVAVQEPELLERLRRLNARLMNADTDPYYGAGTIILVFAHRDNYNRERDGSLVLGTMMLAAHSLGIGTCWINREDHMFDSQEGQEVQKQLGVGLEYVGIGALTAGYPDSAFEVKAKERKKDYFRIIV